MPRLMVPSNASDNPPPSVVIVKARVSAPGKKDPLTGLVRLTKAQFQATPTPAVVLQTRQPGKRGRKRKLPTDAAQSAAPAAKKCKKEKDVGTQEKTDKEKEAFKAWKKQSARMGFMTLWKWPASRLHKLSPEYLARKFGYWFRYLKLVVERCPDTGKLHAHALWLGSYPIRNGKVLKLFEEESLHLEVPGDVYACRDYCDPNYFNKSRNQFKREYTHFAGPWEYGVFNPQGARKDLHQLKERIQSFESLRALWNSEVAYDPFAIKHMQWVETVWWARPQPNLLKNFTPNRFQRQLLDLLLEIEECNTRTSVTGSMRQFLMVADPEGGLGKSDFINWLIDKYDALAPEGKRHDIIQAWSGQRFFCYDLPRRFENQAKGLTMEGVFNSVVGKMERFAAARAFNGKYKSRQKRHKAPTQMLCSNLSVADMAQYSDSWKSLTWDRWNILAPQDGWVYKVDQQYQLYKWKKFEGFER